MMNGPAERENVEIPFAVASLNRIIKRKQLIYIIQEHSTQEIGRTNHEVEIEMKNNIDNSFREPRM